MADSLSSALAALSTTLVYGCPYPSYVSLVSVCSAFDFPACVAPLTNINYDAACCDSLTAYGSSVFDCFTKLNPHCLDTSAFQASLFTITPGDPCAAYATPGAGNSQATTAASTPATATTAAAGGSTETGTGATPIGTGASASGSTTKASAAGKVASAGLKVYLGLAVVGVLAVLNL